MLNNKIFNLAPEGRFYLLAMRFQLMAGNLKPIPHKCTLSLY
jgi:hypothetical protein